MGEKRYLIVNADDFGYTDGVTEGILRAWKEGVVTSTSAMISMPGAVARITNACAECPDLPVGLHLNITAGSPVLPARRVPSLVDEAGKFYPMMKLIERLRSVSLDELNAELNAQAELLISCGIRFDHIDYHQAALALYTPFYPMVIDLAEKYDVPVRNLVPISVYGHIKVKGGSWSRAAVREMMKFAVQHPLLAMKLMPKMTPAAFKKELARLVALGIPAPDWFVDTFYDNASTENFIHILEQLPPGVSEIVAHPAVVDQALRDYGDGYVEARELELAVLIDPRVRAALETQQIELVNFGFIHTARG